MVDAQKERKILEEVVLSFGRWTSPGIFRILGRRIFQRKKEFLARILKGREEEENDEDQMGNGLEDNLIPGPGSEEAHLAGLL